MEGALGAEHLLGPREKDLVCTDGEVGKQISVGPAWGRY